MSDKKKQVQRDQTAKRKPAAKPAGAAKKALQGKKSATKKVRKGTGPKKSQSDAVA